jgi:hypothetical protein
MAPFQKAQGLTIAQALANTTLNRYKSGSTWRYQHTLSNDTFTSGKAALDAYEAAQRFIIPMVTMTPFVLIYADETVNYWDLSAARWVSCTLSQYRQRVDDLSEYAGYEPAVRHMGQR